MYKNIVTQAIRKPLHKSMDITADVLRLDMIHPFVSGNKWFKLKYHIRDALHQHKKGIITFGGSYSNHLVATAVACSENKLSSVGIIRGNETDNPSIRQMKAAGMKLIFVSREQYKNKDQLITNYLSSHPQYYYVPEGGQSEAGIKGAGEILDQAKKDYTHIICSVGTGTTLAGLINASQDKQQIIGISALKVADKNDNELLSFLGSATSKHNYELNFDYHFGGYAKKTGGLIDFMNQLYEDEQIPTDFVYTGKMCYAVFDLVQKNSFREGSTLLLIHTGGLQGNRSLPAGTLVF